MTNLQRQMDSIKYLHAILVTDIAEARIKAGEIMAPDWFMRAYIEGFRVVERIAERKK